MEEWGFLTEHAIVFVNVARQPGISTRQLAKATGISERSLRRVIADLLGSGYVIMKRENREYRVYASLVLSLPSTQREAALGDFLEALGMESEPDTDDSITAS